MTTVTKLIRVEKKTNVPRGSLWPIQARPGPDGIGVRRINASQAVTSQLDTFVFDLLLLPGLSHNSWASRFTSRSRWNWIGYYNNLIRYTIRCTREPTTGKGWGEWKVKRREKKSCASLASGRQPDNDPKDWVGARSNRNVGVAGWTGS